MVCVATEAFAPLAENQARAWGWDVPIAVITHPLGGLPADQVESRATQIVDFLIERFESETVATDREVQGSVDAVLAAPSEPWAFNEFIDARGWGDGLPVLPPTPDRVARMLSAAAVAPDRIVGRVPPERLVATALGVAANAVMAGCSDELLPLVLAAVEASLDDDLNLLGLMATTHPCTVAAIVSGPIVDELGLNAGASLYGPGNRANATLGRAVRLSLKNLGRAWPGPVDKSTQGSAAKYTFAFAENLVDSPWGPYHVDRGLKATDSSITVVGAEGAHNMHDPASTTPENLVSFIAGSMTHAGHNNLYHRGDLFLTLCPEHALVFDEGGWSRDRVRAELFDRTRLQARRMGPEAFEHYLSRWPDRPALEYETAELSIVHDVDDINILVAGGPGKHSSWIPTFGQSRSVIRKL